MATTNTVQTNFDRLTSHLKTGALSARLAAAYVAAPASGQDVALQAVIRRRINEIAQSYEPAADKAD
jgi:hypothetical protein